MPQQLSNLDFASLARIVNLPDPVSAQDAATKAYVDRGIEGLAQKDSARVATQANISLASPGATIDGITMVVNDRVLVPAQTDNTQNGIYIWNGAAVPMTRSLDANTSDKLEAAVIPVEEGTSAGQNYRQTSVNFVLGTGAVQFITFGNAAGAATETSAGIVEIATQAEVNAGTDATRVVTPLTLKTSSLLLRKLSQTFGDGTATQFTITHSFNTEDVHVEVYRTSGNKDTVIVDVDRTSVNAVRLTFAAAPANNAFRVVVLG